jgi:hypothetical protein
LAQIKKWFAAWFDRNVGWLLVLISSAIGIFIGLNPDIFQELLKWFLIASISVIAFGVGLFALMLVVSLLGIPFRK